MRPQFIGGLLVMGIFLSSCDESLPPRQNPADLFSSRVHPYYSYTPTANNVVVDLIAVNNFDETLNDRLHLEGSVVITSSRDTAVHKTIQLDASNLIRGNYDPVKGTLTIDPGDTVVIEAVWDFTDDAGANLTQSFFNYKVDSTCIQRMMSSPESFTVSARSRLFTMLGYAQSQTELTFVYYNEFVGPHDCLPPAPPTKIFDDPKQ